MNRKLSGIIFLVACMSVLASCSVYKYVPSGQYLLDRVEIVSTDRNADVPDCSGYSYQYPNSRWLGLFRLPLRLYSLSGRNTDIGLNRVLRNLGEEPVVYDSLLTLTSVKDMQRALVNAGYLKAGVSSSTVYSRKPKASVRYLLDPGKVYTVSSVTSTVEDSVISILIRDNSSQSLLHEGMNLDAGILDDERERIVELVHRHGYYRFNKDFVTFVADTAINSTDVGLHMIVAGAGTGENGTSRQHTQYTVSDINYIFTDSPNYSQSRTEGMKTDSCDGFRIRYDLQLDCPAIRPEILASHSFLRDGMLYNSDSISKTYTSLSRLGLLKYTNVLFSPVPDTHDRLQADVWLVTRPKHSFSFEVEGTNTAGDLGAAASLSFANRNLFRGAEQLTLKLRGAYESISNLPGYTGDTYLEYGIEADLDFPEFLVPFMTQELQRRSQATSQFSLRANTQKRPEFQKTNFSAGWAYLWSDGWRRQHRLDVVDLNYLVVPWISDHFRTNYLDQVTSATSILKYNYENLLLTKIGYTFYYSNAKSNAVSPFQYSVRVGVETSGNMFNWVSGLTGASKNEAGQYELMNIAFAQYAKHDFSFTANWRLDAIDNFVLHFEYGLAVPYGNSTSLPFEKRYFSGGANSVRGWAVRELGPGTYKGTDRSIDYIKQSGDIKLGASLEYRSKLFWKLNGAIFADAGNIWTIRDYAEQPGGCFSFDTFYRQIAISYGMGLRMDLNFLILRLDGGMKAFNPAGETLYQRIPLVHPNLKRDLAFHLAVGYPF
ncbi:MAG: BamA/TamA family outer membrane protein [Bacteroidaceae bacterium]|nr:BamA/TamA family outer membrane protein [Bacteroidaceae bacterium]